jgi:tetratricopeptide (TPR) repeat protein
LVLLLSVPQAFAQTFIISDIRVEGLQRISAGSVFAALPVGVGDMVDARAIRASARSLFATGNFDDIRIGRDGNVLVVVVAVLNYFSQKAEDQALLMLSSAVSSYEAIQGESGDAAAYQGARDDFMEIIDAHGGNIGGKLANLFLAGASFAAGEYEASETLYEKAAKDFKGVFPFETLAKSSLGYTLAQQGDHEAAAGVFEGMAESDPVMGDELLFALAREYAATGKTELQKETARKLMETYPESIYTNVLKEKFPTLAAAPAG